MHAHSQVSTHYAHTCTHTHTCAKGWPHNPLFFDGVCMWAPGIESRQFSLYTHTHIRGPLTPLKAASFTCERTKSCDWTIYAWQYFNCESGVKNIMNSGCTTLRFIKWWTSQCSLAFCCLYRDYFKQTRPDAKVVSAWSTLFCRRLHSFHHTAHINIVYKRSLQAAPSKPFTSLYSTIFYPSSAVALTCRSVLAGWNTLLHI